MAWKPLTVSKTDFLYWKESGKQSEMVMGYDEIFVSIDYWGVAGLKALVEKLQQRYCSNFGTFSTVRVNDILLGRDGMVDGTKIREERKKTVNLFFDLGKGHLISKNWNTLCFINNT